MEMVISQMHHQTMIHKAPNRSGQISDFGSDQILLNCDPFEPGWIYRISDRISDQIQIYVTLIKSSDTPLK